MKPGDLTKLSFREGDSVHVTIDVRRFRTSGGATTLANAGFGTTENNVIEDGSTHWGSQRTVTINLATTVKLAIDSLTQAADGKKMIAVLSPKYAKSVPTTR